MLLASSLWALCVPTTRSQRLSPMFSFTKTFIWFYILYISPWCILSYFMYEVWDLGQDSFFYCGYPVSLTICFERIISCSFNSANVKTQLSIFSCVYFWVFYSLLIIALSANITQSGLLQPCRRTYYWVLGSVILFQDNFSYCLSLCGLLLQNNTDLVASVTDIYVSLLRRLGSPQLGCQHGQVLGTAFFLAHRQLPSHCTFTWWRKRVPRYLFLFL